MHKTESRKLYLQMRTKPIRGHTVDFCLNGSKRDFTITERFNLLSIPVYINNKWRKIAMRHESSWSQILA